MSQPRKPRPLSYMDDKVAEIVLDFIASISKKFEKKDNEYGSDMLDFWKHIEDDELEQLVKKLRLQFRLEKYTFK